MKPRLAIALCALGILVVSSAGCATRKIASQCRYVDDDGLVRYSEFCSPRKPGEYIVSLGLSTDTKIINEIYGRFAIQTIREVKAPPEYGKQYVRRFLIVITEDPGSEAIFEIAANANGWIRPYVNITPNRISSINDIENPVR